MTENRWPIFIKSCTVCVGLCASVANHAKNVESGVGNRRGRLGEGLNGKSADCQSDLLL